MHCLSESVASNQPQPRGCRHKLSGVERRKFKKRNEARYQQKYKKDFEGLTAENKYLKDIIGSLIAKYLQVPGRYTRQEETSVSHSATQDHHPNHYIQDQHHRGVASDIKGMADSDEMQYGLQLDDLSGDLPSNESTVNQVTEIPIRQPTMDEFLMKIHGIDEKLYALYKERAEACEGLKNCL